MPIIGIEGDIGQGKTLVQTFLLLKERTELKKRIYANYMLKGIPFIPLTFSMLENWRLNKAQFFNVALAIDEIQNWLDSRQSASRENRIISYFVNQAGKSDTNFYYTTQHFGMVEGRLTRRTTYAITVTVDESRGFWRGQPLWHRLEIVHVPRRKKLPDQWLFGPAIWPHYNTREQIDPRPEKKEKEPEWTPPL